MGSVGETILSQEVCAASNEGSGSAVFGCIPTHVQRARTHQIHRLSSLSGRQVMRPMVAPLARPLLLG